MVMVFLTLNPRRVLAACCKVEVIYGAQKLQLIPYQNRIKIVPLKDVKEMRGFLKGIKTEIPREKDRI